MSDLELANPHGFVRSARILDRSRKDAPLFMLLVHTDNQKHMGGNRSYSSEHGARIGFGLHYQSGGKWQEKLKNDQTH